MTTFERIYEQVRRIPRGKVATYGQIAAAAGNPHWSQVVGYALHANPEQYDWGECDCILRHDATKPTDEIRDGRRAGIPCHRVVNRFGETSRAFAFGGGDRQRELLEQEGVVFTAEGRVDLARCLWDGR